MNINEHKANQTILGKLGKSERITYDEYSQYTHKIKNYLLNNDHKNAAEYSIIIGQNFSDFNFSYTEALNNALYELFDDYACQIVSIMTKINDKDILCNLSRIVVNLMGSEPKIASSANFDDEIIEVMAHRITHRNYNAYPFVVIARYVPKEERERFARLIIDYGSRNERRIKMTWAMSHEACLTLSYLQVLPEETVKFLGQKLNEGGCDDMPYEGAMDALPYFYPYIDIILEDIIEQVAEIAGEHYLYNGFFSRLSQCILTKSQAEKILPIFCEKFIVDYDNNPMDFSHQAHFVDALEPSALAFYRQLQLLINSPHCVKGNTK